MKDNVNNSSLTNVVMKKKNMQSANARNVKKFSPRKYHNNFDGSYVGENMN